MEYTWIVGVDGSDAAASALGWATSLARSRSERVTPYAAWMVPLPIWLMSGRRAIDVDRAGIRAETAVHVASVIEALDDAGAVDEARIVEGHPTTVLSELAGPTTPLVVGRRGISELQHRLLGSVSQYLATHAAGPVVVVPEEWTSTRLGRIVVGFDGSDYSVEALRWALSIAPPGAAVEAVVALDVIPWLSPEQVVERHPDAIASARQRIDEAADAADPDRRATRRFEVLGPRHALGQAVVDADLVVVGPRGIGGLARTLLGSVTTWVLHEARCPIAVVPVVE